MDNDMELIKVRAERDQAIKAWKVAQSDIKTFMADNALLKGCLDEVTALSNAQQQRLSAIIDAYHDGEDVGPHIEKAILAGD